MSQQKVFFPTNIKFLRERKKMSQESLANALSFTRSKLASLESGATRAHQPEDLLMISEFFKVGVDALLKVELSKLGEFKVSQLLAGNDVYTTGSNIRVLSITVDKNNKENVEYVPVKAKAGYRNGYNDQQYISNLPKFTMPNLPERGSFRMFPISGDSMLPIPDGSDVIAEYVQDWKAIKAGTLCILILKAEQDFVFKQITVQEEGQFLLTSLNSLYHPYTVPAEEVIEIWKYYKFQSEILPELPTDFQELKRLILDVKQDIQQERSDKA
ncbi:Helix-turn-helix domain-containing protein [Mucilaginibacter pineti]|uniref:Helix-turn-helix domain-containing protein n=1 Tax=Mucilaginibacter pineti TaxID=1391627 RepID=A0A1G7GG48_9SPHI|nr:helix-turn-helix domain-containing protein [Mucilaginibacter pineti]SDE87086.1 Helix-turn-helix domain-containing protein [Mucilaginibacter pineti]